MADSKQEFLDWLRGSQSVFDVVTCDESDLPTQIVRLDGPRLEMEIENAFSTTFGQYDIGSAMPVVRRVSETFTKRISERECKQLDLHPHGLRNAWFSPIYTEFCSLIPLRKLARKLIKRYKDQIFAIPLKFRNMTSLKSWGKNELESLYLAGELRRQNAAVFLFSDHLKSQRIQISLSKAWLRKPFPELRRDEAFRAVMCRTAIRRPDLVVSSAGISRRQWPGLPSILRFVFGPRPSVSFDLKSGPSFGRIQTFVAPRHTPTLEKAFLTLMRPLTEKVARWYRDTLTSWNVETCHIADHASFEGGLLAGEVLRTGGKICIWPHSSNVVHLSIHEPDDVTQITVAARSTGSHWVRTFGQEKVKVDPRAILPDTPPSPPPFDDTRPLTVVLFAGAHMLRRVPLVNYKVHTKAWEKAIEAFARSDVELKLKHKSVWETREWISARAPEHADLTFTNVHANKLMMPNMVFMSISLTSTAIFEGIARGIPGVTVQDLPVDETPYYDPEVIPRVRSDELDAFLSDLNSKAAWEALRERQRVWFEAETTPFASG